MSDTADRRAGAADRRAGTANGRAGAADGRGTTGERRARAGEPPALPPYVAPGPAARDGQGLTGRLAPAVEALPGLGRVAASAAWHTTGWGVRTSARTSRRFLRAVRDPDEAAALAKDATQAATVVSDLTRSVSSGTPIGKALAHAAEAFGEIVESEPVVTGQVVSYGGHATRRDEAPPPLSLREQGARLLERSRDVWETESSHPAYGRILGEVAPDEARILLLLLRGGPQPSVDVRTGGPIGMVNSQLIAPGLTMIGGRAGCRYLDQVPAYLNNLFRLGLVWFSREALRDPMDYQVLEAQPDVLAAVHSVRFAKVVRRSIHLTPFGEDFCRTCLVDEESAAVEFPAHATPPESEAGDTPRAVTPEG